MFEPHTHTNQPWCISKDLNHTTMLRGLSTCKAQLQIGSHKGTRASDLACGIVFPSSTFTNLMILGTSSFFNKPRHHFFIQVLSFARRVPSRIFLTYGGKPNTIKKDGSIMIVAVAILYHNNRTRKWNHQLLGFVKIHGNFHFIHG